MTIYDIITLLPLIAIALTAVTVMLSIAFYRCHILTVFLALAGITSSFIAFINIYSSMPRRITELLIMDYYAFFYTGLILAAGFIVVVLSYSYLEKREGNREEFYLLLLLSMLGAAVLVASSHFVSFFLGLEILSVSLYVLIAYLDAGTRSIEAGIKYLVLASVSVAFLLLGMAFAYAETGTMSFARIVAAVSNADNEFLLAGVIMITIGIGFKLALVPFHMWTPDVYEGAPAPVSAFIATASKGAVFAFLFRYFTFSDIQANHLLFTIFSSMAVASMFFGNLLALLQNNVKRILAYSSISHLGYLLVAFLASKAYAFTAVTIYLVAYFITTLGAFGVITAFSGGPRDADTIDDYRGIAWKQPWLTGVFTVMLLSLAGIPLTAGFIGKFYILEAGTGSSLWFLVVMLAVNSVLGLFYYLHVVVALFSRTAGNAANESTALSVKISLADSISLTVLTFLLLWLGVYPSLFIEIIQKIGSKFT